MAEEHDYDDAFEQAVKTIGQDASRHEFETTGNHDTFCATHRSRSVAMVMFHLGLDIGDLGCIAEEFLAVVIEADSAEHSHPVGETWPEQITD